MCGSKTKVTIGLEVIAAAATTTTAKPSVADSHVTSYTHPPPHPLLHSKNLF